MPRIVNRYPGACRHCGQEVATEAGFAVRDNPHAAWEVEHDGECPPNPHNPGGAPTWTVGGGEGYGQQPYKTGTTRREEWWTRRAARHRYQDKRPHGPVKHQHDGQCGDGRGRAHLLPGAGQYTIQRAGPTCRC